MLSFDCVLRHMIGFPVLDSGEIDMGPGGCISPRQST
jgi:hypothetical protein